jgi:hypothetical protein
MPRRPLPPPWRDVAISLFTLKFALMRRFLNPSCLARPLFFMLVLTLWLGETAAQTGTLRGFVYDKGTGEPILFTNVFLAGTTIGASTDVNGFFTIKNVPTGQYRLTSTYLGYDTASVPVNLSAGATLSFRLLLNKSSIGLREVEVLGAKQEQLTNTRVSVETVTPKQITQVVSVGGEADIAQYLQVLPGVVFTGDQGGQLYIRGGSPVMNKVMLDGMLLYNPFHSIGLYSVFETDLIKNAEVFTGAYNANHGGRISAVMDVTTRDGNQKRLSGKIGVSPFLSRLVLEGPLWKSKKNEGSTPTFIFSAKGSYLDQTSKALYSYAGPQGLPFSFLDLYGKTTFKSNSGSKLSLFGFNMRDRANFRGIADVDWVSTGAGTQFVLIPEGAGNTISGNLAYSNFVSGQTEADGRPRRSSITGFNGTVAVTQYLNSGQANFGFDLVGLSTDFNFTNSVGKIIRQQESTTELAVFGKYNLVFDKWVLEPGLRAHYYSSLTEMSLEPRFSAKYNARSDLRFKVAAGKYSQNLISATSDRDVVNLFLGFLSGPDNLPKTFDGQEVTSRLQKANHLVGGVEIDLGPRIEINAETYIKQFTQLTNINRDKIFDDIEANFGKPDALKKDFILERGQAYGFDFRVKYDVKRFYLWTTYSWTYVDRFDGIRTYNPVFDRRHNINVVSNYTFGNELQWELSGRWNLGTGFPFTQTQGFYPQVDFGAGAGTDYINQGGELGVLFADFNKGRLPTYHRLDLALRYRKEWNNDRSMDINFSITNAYDRRNIFYFDRIRYTRVDQLPILPALGLVFHF